MPNFGVGPHNRPLPTNYLQDNLIYMKRISALLLAFAAVMLLAVSCKDCKPAQKGALEVIKARTSIRSFTGDKLTEEQINTLLDAAMAAPTASDIRPWRFVVLTGDEAKLGLYEREHHQKMVSEAGAVIVVCGETTRMARPRGAAEDAPLEEVPVRYWFEDCSAATENLLLAATAMDLGAVWLSCYPNENSVERVSKYLGLPANVVPLAIVPVGVPAENPEPKAKWNADNIHYEKW